MTYSFEFISNKLKRIIEPATLHTHRFDGPLGLRVFRKSYVAPYVGWTKSIGCVIDEDGHEIKDSECIEWKENAAYYDLSTCAFVHKRVVFLGFLLTGFGHSYTDDLRKLWFLKTDECRSLVANGYELVYTTSWNLPIPTEVLDIFELAGVNLSGAWHVRQLTHFDEIVIPDNSFKATDYGRVYSREYVEMINGIKLAVPDSTKSVSKLYLSRTKFSIGSKKERGEEEVESVFRSLGYEIVFPEEHSVVEQIQMVRSCDHFAATEGSVSHLSLFCKPETDVIIIVKANYLNFHQVMVNEFADLRVTYIEAHHSSMANKKYPWCGPFFLCVNRHLERFVQRPILHFPYWMRFSYWEYSRSYIFRGYNRVRKIMRKRKTL